MEELWSGINRLLGAMETGKGQLSQAEEMVEAEAAWEEEMVRRNRLANLGFPRDEKQTVERFQDGVAAVAELERCRVPRPRTFFSRTGHWSDMELLAAVEQGLWEVGMAKEGNSFIFVKLQGYSLAIQPSHLSKERWQELLGVGLLGVIPSVPLGGSSALHQQRIAKALTKAREAMDQDPHPLLSIRRGLVVQEHIVNPEMEVRFLLFTRSLFSPCMAGSSAEPKRRFSSGGMRPAAGRRRGGAAACWRRDCGRRWSPTPSASPLTSSSSGWTLWWPGSAGREACWRRG